MSSGPLASTARNMTQLSPFTCHDISCTPSTDSRQARVTVSLDKRLCRTCLTLCRAIAQARIACVHHACIKHAVPMQPSGL